MDPKLAAIYGTNEVNDSDLEKLAAAELAEGLANDDELDTDGLSEDDLEAIAQDVLSAASDDDVEDDGQEKISEAEEAQEKLAEADYLGRVMAHAYVNELRGIEKTAKRSLTEGEGIAQFEAGRARYDKMGKQGPSLGARAENKLRGAGSKLRGAASSVGETAKKGGGRVSKSLQRGAETLKAGVTGHYGSGAYSKALEAGHHLSGGQRAKILGKAGLGVAAVGGAAYGAKKLLGKKKQSSAMDTLIEARAMEILEESGIDPAELQMEQGQEKVSDPREALAAAVEERTWALLGQYGVVPAEQDEE